MAHDAYGQGLLYLFTLVLFWELLPLSPQSAPSLPLASPPFTSHTSISPPSAINLCKKNQFNLPNNARTSMHAITNIQVIIALTISFIIIHHETRRT